MKGYKSEKCVPMSFDDYKAMGVERFGENYADWVLICPACGTKQTPREVANAGGNIDTQAGFSCIGRFPNAVKNLGCDWTLGGLFQIHEVMCTQGDTKCPMFKIAEKGAISDLARRKAA
jgi:hypothetical protein